jgi:hypothetical protein
MTQSVTPRSAGEITPQGSYESTATVGQSAGGRAVRGPLLFSTVSGHVPNGDNQIGLGATTMHQAGADVGYTRQTAATDRLARLMSNYPRRRP